MPISVKPLPGGVSSNVWRIDTFDALFVLKQPLEKLATAADWRSGLGRLEREVACLRFLAEILPSGQVPEVIAHDPIAHVVLMTSAPKSAGSWKALLVGGHFDPDTAAAAATLLRRIHEESEAQSDRIRPEFDDITFFDELRIDPFHRFLMQQYPGLAPDIEHLVEQLLTHRTCLTHGDYSPKNILVGDDGGLILLDFEVAHWGNPVFDLAYCIGHLMLKGWALRREVEATDLIVRFLSAYDRKTDPLLPHLGLMLLARLDGKSTIDYIADQMLRARIRSIAHSWIANIHDQEPMSFIYMALGVDDLL